MSSGFFTRKTLMSLEPAPSAPLGLIVSDVTNPFFAEVIPAIEECLDAAGFTTLLGNASEDCTREERLLKTMREFPPSGVLICPSSSRDRFGTHCLIQ
jgi:LacI family transcriptional regulator